MGIAKSCTGRSAWTLMLAGAVASAALVAPPVAAQPARAEKVAITASARAHIDASMKLAKGVVPDFALSSYYNTLRLSRIVDNGQLPPGANNFMPGGARAAIPATKLFDQLYYVGSEHVGALILVTSAGIIQFDAMNNDAEASEIIEAGYRKLGLDPAAIRYLVLTHAHGDHNGGANYFRRKYPGIRIISTEADWQMMAGWATNPDRFGEPPPPRDMTVADGERLKLGNIEIRFHISPGHTPGTLSAIIPVTDKGRQLRIGLFGGVGMPMKPQALNEYDASWKRFGELMASAGAQSVLSTHPAYDGTLFYITDPASRPNRSNPWVMGKPGVASYVAAVRQAVAALKEIQAQPR